MACVDRVAYIDDITVTADCNDMSDLYREKVYYYARLFNVIDCVSNGFRGQPSDFRAAVLN